MHSNWKRVGLGACTVTAVALTAGLAMAPAAQAATTPTGGLLGGVTSTLTGATSALTGTTGSTGTGSLTGTVTDLLNGLLNGTATPSGSPVTLNTSNGTINVGVGTGGTGIGLSIGSTSNGAAVTATVTGGTPTTTTTTTTTPSDPATTTTTTSGTAPAVTGLRITSSVDTVYPVKDGYRDSVVLHVVGTTASGTEQPVSGVVVVKRGSTEVKRWTISRSTQDLTWDGRSNGKVVAGAYTVTGVEVDSTGSAVAATDALSVSAKKLVSASSVVSTKSVSGTHRLPKKARAALKAGIKVSLRITATATGVTGKQYLVLSHGAKKIKVRIENGTHTSKAVTVPKSFTTYKVSRTWKTGTVTLSAVKHKYTYKKLK